MKRRKKAASPNLIGNPPTRGILWMLVSAGALVTAPALLGLATGSVLLFPSLGPTAVMLALAPEHPSSRPYHVVVGHLCGIAAAYGAVLLFGVAQSPSVFALGALTPGHAAASVAAVMLTAALQLGLRAIHPPAAATTLLIALGAFAFSVRDALVLVLGIVLVAALGEVLRRVLPAAAR